MTPAGFIPIAGPLTLAEFRAAVEHSIDTLMGHVTRGELVAEIRGLLERCAEAKTGDAT